MPFFLCNKREIAVKPTIHPNSAVSKVLFRKILKSQIINIADMPTFPKPKEGDFPRLASPEGPPWLDLRGRKF